MTAIATQGDPKDNFWTKTYQVSYTTDGQEWKWVHGTAIGGYQGGAAFDANWDRNTIARNEMPALESRLLRSQPFTVTNWPTCLGSANNDFMVNHVLIMSSFRSGTGLRSRSGASRSVALAYSLGGLRAHPGVSSNWGAAPLPTSGVP